MSAWSFYKPCNVDTDFSPGSDLHRLIESKLPARGLHHVGRLDRDTSGLLLITTDGSLTHLLLSSTSLKKTYIARVGKPPTPDQLTQLCNGVHLGDGPATAITANTVSDEDPCTGPLFMCANFQKVDPVNHFVRVTTCEGRNRIVRRMLASVGLPVLALHRERIGALSLNPIAVPGAIVPLTNSEISSLTSPS
jgi:pseudouridine synthase